MKVNKVIKVSKNKKS